MKHTDNYRLQVEGAKKYFLRYDQEKLIEKLGLNRDSDYLYTHMLSTSYRIHRRTGLVERLAGEWVETNDHGEVMTLLDLICDSREDYIPMLAAGVVLATPVPEKFWKWICCSSSRIFAASAPISSRIRAISSSIAAISSSRAATEAVASAQ